VKIEPHILIFDTGPLWELVLYRAVHNLSFEKLNSELHHLTTVASYDNFSRFVASFSQKTTSPHVVAEISSKVIRTAKHGQEDIWTMVYNEFSAMGMDEKTIELLQMPKELVAKLGAVDVSVLELGSSFAPGSSIILSIDNTLIAECNRAGFSAKHLYEAIA
jgi:hypothetical protein